MKSSKLSERTGSNHQQDSTSQHLRTGTHRLCSRQRKLASQGRSDRPTDRRNNQCRRSNRIDRSISEIRRVADQHGHTCDSPDQTERQFPCEPLALQNQNVRNRHERRNRCHHDRRNSRWHLLFCPEKQPIVENENEDSQQCRRAPFSPRRRWRSLHPQPCVKGKASDQEPHPREEKWRYFAYSNANREKSGTPDKIDNPESQQNLPFRGMG